MPSTIACPGCQRPLTLPAEAMNRLVQCPACKQQFHPAEAETAAIRPNLPKVDFSPSKPPLAASGPPANGPPAHSPPPGPPPGADLARGSRRREEYDVCPKCKARCPRNANRCPECGVEFEEEKDDEYRPWERSGEERRDSEPHRGNLLLFMGIGSILTALGFMCPFVGAAATLIGTILGIAVWIMARADLRKMDQHIMAREGRGSTHGGMICGIIGTILNVLGLLVASAILVSMLL